MISIYNHNNRFTILLMKRGKKNYSEPKIKILEILMKAVFNNKTISMIATTRDKIFIFNVKAHIYKKIKFILIKNILFTQTNDLAAIINAAL